MSKERREWSLKNRARVDNVRVTVDLHQGRGHAADGLFAADYRCHFPGFPQPTDQPEHDRLTLTFIGRDMGAFPDGRFTISDVIAEGDRVFSRYTFRGTYQRPWIFKMTPTGRPLSFIGTEVHRLAGRAIVEQWSDFDTLSIMQQLGVLPALAIPATSDVA
jgi:predicted ester cyclase